MKMLKDKIRELRQKEGLTQEALANRIHVSRSLIAKWESGKGMPTESDLALLSELFDVSSQELVSDRECERTIVKKNRKIRGLYAAIVFLTAVLSVTTTLTICAYSGIIGLRGEQSSSEIKHIHQYEIAETIAPTCIDDGIVRYECACKDEYEEILSAYGHDYSDWLYIEPTEAEVGKKERSCLKCAHRESYAIYIPLSDPANIQHAVSTGEKGIFIVEYDPNGNRVCQWQYDYVDDTLVSYIYSGYSEFFQSSTYIVYVESKDQTVFVYREFTTSSSFDFIEATMVKEETRIVDGYDMSGITSLPENR